MAELREVSGSRTCILQPDHLIGRGPECALRLIPSEVSAQHALLRWQGQHWEVIDRGSLNGTWLNGSQLTPGKAYRVKQGEVLSFGEQSETWALADASEPSTMVVAVDTGEIILGSTGVIGIPSSDDVRATLYLDLDGTWKIETPDADAQPIANGDIFRSAGRLFRFCQPNSTGPTAAGSGVSVRTVLHFSVSRDEEYVSLRLEHPSGEVDLGSRVQNYLLLLLARAYQTDIESGFSPEACGWVDKQQLATSLRTTEQQIDGEVHRIRKHFGQHGLPHAATIVDRRERTRQLRIGIFDFRIHAE